MKNTLQLFALSCFIISPAVNGMGVILDNNEQPKKEQTSAGRVSKTAHTKDAQKDKPEQPKKEQKPTEKEVKAPNTQKEPQNATKVLLPVQGKLSKIVNYAICLVTLKSAWNWALTKTNLKDWSLKPVYTFADNSRFAKLNTISRANIFHGLTAAGVLVGAYKVIRNYYNTVEEDIFTNN